LAILASCSHFSLSRLALFNANDSAAFSVLSLKACSAYSFLWNLIYSAASSAAYWAASALFSLALEAFSFFCCYSASLAA